MIAPLAKLMDWSAIQAVALMMPANVANLRLEEALGYLKGPEFIPDDSQPAQVEFNGSLHSRFPTLRPCGFAENRLSGCRNDITKEISFYYLYLDPRSNKFGFIPWDLDAAWGNFWIGTKAEQQQSSIWRPWVGENRFLERMMAVEEFRRIYRAHLEDFLARLYEPERLNRRIDAIAAAIREPIAAESSYRLDKFDQAVGLKPVAPGKWWDVIDSPAYDLKQFIAGRARSVRSQLAGESQGLVLKYPKKW